ncbi:conjugal transfer protein TraI [Pedobacter paludis]|uniref:Conjugal transfer protein TraI n=1 Tax=Pedobacter paludis TaxID=2203212 RepID=A0A317F2X3_9SPHI|nr:conjugal transfer protein TraI [Pedobacter paludis]PWS32189.1 conjugal transfer protein TraI [Pedobacter paludis]
MKKTIIAVVMCIVLIAAPTQKSQAIVWVIVNAAVKKVVVAIDLQIQRQQNKVIWAQNLQKQIENALSKLKLDEITDWTKKQKEQYQKYFDELQKVRSWIAYYQRVKEVISKQKKLVREYQKAWTVVRNDKHFTPREIEHMGEVYLGILKESLENIDQITVVMTSMKTQMSDQKRLEIINHAADRIDFNYSDLRDFNNENALLSLQRSKDQSEIETIRNLYGIK